MEMETDDGESTSFAPSFDPDAYEYEDVVDNPPALDRFYGPLNNYTKMVTRGYQRLFLLDASGGLGKTYNVKRVLRDELPEGKWTHNKGFTTPVELYKTLYMAQDSGHVLFLDDMSGLRHNQKALDMLKAATETDGEENWVQYRSSNTMTHPETGHELPQTFCFRGSIIMSFNDTPNSSDFRALRDRAVYYQLSFTYDERIDLIREVAKVPDLSLLTISEQQQCAEWIADVTDESFEVSIRTLEEVCTMRHFGQIEGEDWRDMALEAFDLDREKHLIIRMRERSELPISEQIDIFCERTGRSERYYYKVLEEIKSERM